MGAVGTIYDRRWLVGYFVQRQLSSSYRGSFLGFVWAFITPLFMIALYTLIFSEIVGLRFREVEGNSALNFGFYLYCGILPFLAFSEALNKATNLIRSNVGLVKRLVFPVEVLPLTTAVTSIVDKLFGLAMLALVLAVFGYGVQWTLLMLPVIVVLQLLFTMGLTYLFAVIGTYLPDVRETLRSVVRASFFLTPIIWPISRVEGKVIDWRIDINLERIVYLNPLTFLVESYRAVIIDGTMPATSSLLYFGLFAGALFVVGFSLFVLTRPRFSDLI